MIEIVVSVSADGTFTRVAAQEDDGGHEDGDGVEHHDDGLVVEGVLVGIAEGVIEVSPGEGSTAVTCLVPESADLSTFAPGDEVRMRCEYEDEDTLVLVRLKSATAFWPPEDEYECQSDGCEPDQYESEEPPLASAST
jgi:hypothetical protein